MCSTDLRRKRFGRLIAIRKTLSYKDGLNGSLWECICDCGNIKEIYRNNLLNGNTTSCGCFAKEETKRRCWTGYQEISGTYWKDINRNAKYRLINFNITIEYAWDLFLKQNRKCALTGIELKFGRGKERTASLDRIDNNKGYVEKNVRWVHKKVNALKSDFSDEDLLYWSRKIVEFNKDL